MKNPRMKPKCLFVDMSGQNVFFPLSMASLWTYTYPHPSNQSPIEPGIEIEFST